MLRLGSCFDKAQQNGKSSISQLLLRSFLRQARDGLWDPSKDKRWVFRENLFSSKLHDDLSAM
jgi:hypothetical protein